MANEHKLTTVGQMKAFAQQQDARDDAQDELMQQMNEEKDTFLKYTEQNLTEEQKAQARRNIGAAESGSVLTAITREQIEALMAK